MSQELTKALGDIANLKLGKQEGNAMTKTSVEIVDNAREFKFRLKQEMIDARGNVLNVEFSEWKTKGILAHKFEMTGQTWYCASSEWDGTFTPFVPFRVALEGEAVVRWFVGTTIIVKDNPVEKKRDKDKSRTKASRN